MAVPTKKELDNSNEIIVSLAIEVPYWIPIKSGEYQLQNNKSIKVRNDFWLVSTGNLVDNPDPFPDFISRSHSIIPLKGIITATPLSIEWEAQLENTIFGILQQQSKIEEFLEDTNLFISLYSALISPKNASREVRQVSFYETMIHVRIICRNDKYHFENLTRMSPDWKTVGHPYPPSRVKDQAALKTFKDTISTSGPPEFHQLEWMKTINYRREKQYQDALLHATITLEALAHIYLAKSIPSRKNRKQVIWNAGGLAEWLLSLNIEGLKEESENVKQLRKLRNDVVHREKVLTDGDVEQVKSGIDSLTLVRSYLLQIGKPEILKLENKFTSFLDRVELGKAISSNVGQMVPLRFGWRKEKDCYQTISIPKESRDVPQTDE